MINVNNLVKFRPSSASRTYHCPAAAIVEARLAKWAGDIYAATGTGVMAHIDTALAELADEDYFDDLVGKTEKVDGFDVTYTQDDMDAAKVCFAEVQAMEAPGAKLYIEKDVAAVIDVAQGQKVSYKGRLDFLVATADKYVILDYKHGVGIAVSATDNKQLWMYLIAVVQTFGPKKEYELRIVQPRSPVQKENRIEIPGDKLEGIVGGFRAAMARSLDAAGKLVSEGCIPLGAYCPGDHCKYCAIEHGCPGKMNKAVSTAAMTGLAYDNGAPLKWLLNSADEVRGMLSGAEQKASEIILAGGVVPGYKLIESTGNRSLRKNLSPAEIEELKAAKLVRMEPKMPTLAQLEKAEKKGEIEAAKFIQDGQKKPKLVPWNTIGTQWGATDDFEAGTVEETKE